MFLYVDAGKMKGTEPDRDVLLRMFQMGTGMRTSGISDALINEATKYATEAIPSHNIQGMNMFSGDQGIRSNGVPWQARCDF